MSQLSFLRTYLQRKGANIAPSSTCKYIEREPPYGPDPWCGEKTQSGSSWCPHHHAIVYRPMDEVANRNFIRGCERIARAGR